MNIPQTTLTTQQRQNSGRLHSADRNHWIEHYKRQSSSISPPRNNLHDLESLSTNKCWSCDHKFHSQRMCMDKETIYIEPTLRTSRPNNYYLGATGSSSSVLKDDEQVFWMKPRHSKNAPVLCRCITTWDTYY